MKKTPSILSKRATSYSILRIDLLPIPAHTAHIAGTEENKFKLSGSLTISQRYTSMTTSGAPPVT